MAQTPPPDVTAFELERALALLERSGRQVRVVPLRVGGYFPGGPERVLRMRPQADGSLELLVGRQFALGETTRRRRRP